jgi:RNA polymerase sigma-70 factor, ECF subfamily
MTTTPTAQAVTGALVDAARAGDAEAWERIVTDLGPRIRGYARARGAPDPDDVTQDVFVAAAARIGDFEGDESALRSWLFGIAYRQVVNRHRAAAKQAAPLPDTLPDTAASPEDRVVGAIEASEAVAALDVLSDLERDIVLMRVIGELDSKDVAAAVGKRAGNVRVIQSRAMAKLRAELERRGYGAAAGWAGALVAGVVGPLAPAHASAVAAAAATGTAAAATVAVAAGASSAVKIAAAAVITAVVGGGVVAGTGNLPDPLQSGVADIADRIGITLPRPEGPHQPAPATDVPGLEVPDAPLADPEDLLTDPEDLLTDLQTLLPDAPDVDTPDTTVTDLPVDTRDPFDPGIQDAPDLPDVDVPAVTIPDAELPDTEPPLP